MHDNLILFTPNLNRIEASQAYVNTVDIFQLLDSIFIGEIIIVENTKSGNFLFLHDVAAIGFLLELRSRISAISRDGGHGSHRLLKNEIEYYKFEVSGSRDLLTLHDEKNMKQVTVNRDAFHKNVDQLCVDMVQLVSWFFPTLRNRKEFFELKEMVGSPKGG